MTKQILGLALAAAWMGSAAVWAQAPAPPLAAPTAPAAAPMLPHGNQVQGKVTAVDTAKNAVTVSNRRSGTSTMLTLAPDAKILVTQTATVGDVKTGDAIEAYGNVTPGATTIAANRIAVVPARTPHGKLGPNAGYHKNGVQGTVASTSPSLTITTPGGVTVTVTTMADTRVTKIVPGTLADVAVGANVQARTTGDAANPTATELRVLPAKAGHRGHRRLKNAAGAVTPQQ